MPKRKSQGLSIQHLRQLIGIIGKRINDEVLENKRAGYGKEIVKTLSAELTKEYGRGWSEKQLRHCLRFAETFADFEIVSALQRQLSWTHFKTMIYLKTELQREFYAQMCLLENWNTRTLHQFSQVAKKIIENRIDMRENNE